MKSKRSNWIKLLDWFDSVSNMSLSIRTALIIVAVFVALIVGVNVYLMPKIYDQCHKEASASECMWNIKWYTAKYVWTYIHGK